MVFSRFANTRESSSARAASPLGEWLLAVSFANVFYLRTWEAILDTGRNVTAQAYVIAVANVLLLATVFWATYVLVWRTGKLCVGKQWVRRCSVIAAAGLLLIPFHAFATICCADDVPKRNAVYAAALVTALAMVASGRTRTFGLYLLRVFMALVVVTFGQCIWRAATYDAAQWALPSPSSTAAARTPRLVWMIFDEWDYGLSFDPRPQWLRTPELDRLTAVSFSASQAVSPGAETDTAMPRLLTGDAAAEKKNLRTAPTVFSRARAEGLRPAVSGWYVDYCGALSEPLDACWSTNADAARNSMGAAPAEIAVNQVKYLFENQFRSPFGQSVGTKRHVLDYALVTRGALQAASSPAFDLVFVHFPIPHPPLFYDRTTGRYDLGDTPLVGLTRRNSARYLDAIELVDRTIGRVRQALESSDLWDRTHMIISSDHAARNRERISNGGFDARVPFIVRIAGSERALAYDDPFTTLVSSDLAMALLRREIHSTAQVRAFIDDWMTATFSRGPRRHVPSRAASHDPMAADR